MVKVGWFSPPFATAHRKFKNEDYYLLGYDTV
jgi:hypothetical protein